MIQYFFSDLLYVTSNDARLQKALCFFSGWVPRLAKSWFCQEKLNRNHGFNILDNLDRNQYQNLKTEKPYWNRKGRRHYIQSISEAHVGRSLAHEGLVFALLLLLYFSLRLSKVIYQVYKQNIS